LGNNILMVPCCEKGKGGGHLSRCIRLVSDLRALNRGVWLYLPQNIKLPGSMNFNPEWSVRDQTLPDLKIGLIITDRFKTPRHELEKWKKISPVIGMDEGGECRDTFDFLLDILVPYNFISPPANITSPSLLDCLQNKNHKKESAQVVKTKILITFGHEDSNDLGAKIAKSLTVKKIKNIEITLLTGALKRNHSLPADLSNIKIINTIPNLAEHLHEYDLVITHYGLTAYEAVFSGTAVLLVHPTPLHKRLSKTAGFLSFSINFINKITHEPRDAKIIGIREYYKKFASNIKSGSKNAGLAGLIDSISPQVNRSCPVCGENAPEHSVMRFYDRTYRRCRKCSNIYMDRAFPPPIEYEKEYFYESYKKQYGKTYIEDFPNLTKAAKKRFKTIKSILRTDEKPSLLDIGCAYGPFLAAAREEGFSPYGVEPSGDAVSYVQNKLGIPASAGFFPGCNASFLVPGSFNAVTLWYVIEHFKDCAPVLSEIHKLLKPGGLLAFSTPSFSGISGRSSLKNFLSKSPADHYTIWSPATCRKALSLAGFTVKRIIISGHHPERFPFFGKLSKNKKSFAYFILSAISRIFKLGDTFEVYAEAK